ncbi:MAG: RsmG family class I SAM-dependent methyltransferase [Deinococcales bacterium]
MSAYQEQQLEDYQVLVMRYHQTLDLMSGRGLEHLPQKIQESVAYADHLKNLPPLSPILDIGSGAGLPAIIIAIANPQHKLYLVERRQKRAAFLNIVKAQLGLNHIEVFAQDVKDLSLSALPPMAAVTALAVGDFALLYQLSQPLQATSCQFLSRKALGWSLEDEIWPSEHQISLKQEIKLNDHAKLIAITIEPRQNGSSIS